MDKSMTIDIATSDADIIACFAVMKELRPHLNESDFLSRVRNQADAGYQLAFLKAPEGIAAVAGFRIAENLAWGRFLYVDDLVTRGSLRSQGYGASMMRWLKAYAATHGCAQIHLDSGVERKSAHRFYEREGMKKIGFHYAEELTSDMTRQPSPKR